MTTAKRSLIEDAKAAGYEVKIGEGEHVEITKWVGRWQKVTGLVIYGDGTAFLIDMDLSAAKGVRAYKAMRSLLGI